MIEVEYRAFLDENIYTQLLARFRSKNPDAHPVRQITHYLECEVDTRIQLSRRSGKLWQKLGQMHDIVRPEIEIHLSRNDASTLLQIMKNLGLGVRVTWYRDRIQFRIGEITLSLDYTIGYGYILEVEILCEPERAQSSRNVLLEFMCGLGIVPTSKSDLDAAFERYLSQGPPPLDESWLDQEGT